MSEIDSITAADGIATLLELGLDPSQADIAHTQCPALEAAAADGYRVLTPIAQGGFGQVWRAVQLRPRRDVAIKCIRDGLEDSEKKLAIEMLRIESDLLSRLNDSRILSLQRTIGEGESCFLALEYIDGDPVNDHCEWNKIDIDGRLDLIEQIIAAIAELHQTGIAHGDIKPANVLMRDARTPVIVDFGMAVNYTRQQVRLTPPQYLGGTPAYMAPELVDKSAEALGPTADVFALSVLALELIDTAPDPWDIPKSVRRALNRGLAANPKQRTADAEEMLADFRRARLHVPLIARRPVQIAFASLALALSATGWFAAQSKTQAEPEITQKQPVLAAAPPVYSGVVSLLREENLSYAKRLLDEVDLADRGWEWAYLYDWAETGDPEITDRALGKPNTHDASWSSDSQALAYSTGNYEVWAIPPDREAVLVDRLPMSPQFVAVDNAGEHILVTTSEGVLFHCQLTDNDRSVEAVPLPQKVLTVRMAERITSLSAWALMKQPYRLQHLIWDGVSSSWEPTELFDCENALFGMNPDYPVMLICNTGTERAVQVLDSRGDLVLEAALPEHIRPMSYAYNQATHQLYVANYYGQIWLQDKNSKWTDFLQLPTEQAVLSMDIAPKEKRLFLASEDAYVVNAESGRILLRLNDDTRTNIILKIRWDRASHTLHALTSDHARTWGSRESLVLR